MPWELIEDDYLRFGIGEDSADTMRRNLRRSWLGVLHRIKKLGLRLRPGNAVPADTLARELGVDRRRLVVVMRWAGVLPLPVYRHQADPRVKPPKVHRRYDRFSAEEAMREWNTALSLKELKGRYQAAHVTIREAVRAVCSEAFITARTTRLRTEFLPAFEAQLASVRTEQAARRTRSATRLQAKHREARRDRLRAFLEA